jgi:hypothetical protein
MIVDQGIKGTKISEWAANDEIRGSKLRRNKVCRGHRLPKKEKCLDEARLTGAIASKYQSDGPNGNPLAGPKHLEVFDFERR